jgi:hypothetical protein
MVEERTEQLQSALRQLERSYGDTGTVVVDKSNLKVYREALAVRPKNFRPPIRVEGQSWKAQDAPDPVG